MLAELGIGGAIGLLMFLDPGVLGGTHAPAPTLASGDPALKIAALGMFTAWLAATSVDWLYDIPGLAGMAILAAAVLVAPAPAVVRPGREVCRRARRGRGEQTALVVALTASGPGCGEPRTPIRRRFYSNSGAGLVSKHPVKALQKLKTAEQLDPWSMQTQYAVASAYARSE